jgi:hypothetical protein
MSTEAADLMVPTFGRDLIIFRSRGWRMSTYCYPYKWDRLTHPGLFHRVFVAVIRAPQRHAKESLAEETSIRRMWMEQAANQIELNVF